jgi:hypothetical protein
MPVGRNLQDHSIEAHAFVGADRALVQIAQNIFVA